MNAQEQGKCDFCGETKPVSRQYLHAKNPKRFEETGADPFTMTRYCRDCGLQEKLSTDSIDKPAKEE